MPASISDTKPWLHNGTPALVAHRGFAQQYPENTLEALSAAVEAGAKHIEFDVQLSADGVPFLMHDDNFSRTASLDLNVFDLTMAEIEKLCIGEPQKFGDRFSTVYPVTLSAACEALNTWTDVHFFIEIKRQSLEHFGVPETLANIFEAIKNLTCDYTLMSFSLECIAHLQREHNYQVAWVVRDWNQKNLEHLQALQPHFVFCNQMKIPDKDKLPQGDWHWIIYEITSVHSAEYWRRRGASLIETMQVEDLLQSHLFTRSGSSNE